uniref:Uncharacterized protein n=1 Tax=Solanum tuberosum TaxID=4113 RepID=M1DH43_SOLTU
MDTTSQKGTKRLKRTKKRRHEDSRVHLASRRRIFTSPFVPEKEITSSHHTSVEKTKESKEGKTPRWTSVFERIGRLTPRVFAFERLGHKDEEEFSEQVEGDATTSKTSVFHRLGAKRKSLSGKTLLE